MTPRAAVRVAGEQATIEVPRALVGGLRGGEVFFPISHAPDAVLFVRAAEPYLAGSLSAMSLPELLGQLTSGLRSGVLSVQSRRGAVLVRRTVSLRDGLVAFATSTEPAERLGRLLVKKKLLSAQQIETALESVKPGLKLGQVLTRAGMISATALYGAMADLVREIVLALFELREGDFLFREGALVEDVVKMPGRTKDLLLEGLKRSESIDRLRAKFPVKGRFVAGHAPSPGDGQALVDAAKAGADLVTLRAAFDGGEYRFLEVLDQLVTRGALVQKTEAPSGAKRVESSGPLELYRHLIGAVCESLVAAGQSLDELRSFLSDPLPGMEESLRGVTLSDQGELDVARVLANTQKLGGPMAKAVAYETLDAFVSYVLFSAKNSLPPESFEGLNREYRRLREELDE